MSSIVKQDLRSLAQMIAADDIWTSLDLSTDRGRQLLAESMLPTAPKLDDVINSTIEVVDIVVQPAGGQVNEQGEIDEYFGITLIHPDGKMHWTGSKQVKKSLSAAMLWLGQPPWNPPAKFVVVQSSFVSKDGKPGRSYYLKPFVELSGNKKK